jgi:hypothetical protein
MIGQWHGFTVWSIQQSIPRFFKEVSELLIQRRIVSACVLNEPPPEGKEWIFFEWHGRLLIDLRLVDKIFGEVSGWKQTQVREDLRVAIFQPMAQGDSNFRIQARNYRELLDAGERGEIILRREWLEIEGAHERLFGQYSDPKIGGAIALLALSGAADPAVDKITLRTPAALELDIDMSQDSLVGEPARELLTIHCLGCSNLQEAQSGYFTTSFQRWIELYNETKNSSPAPYFIALELRAEADPTIAIKRGTVFEQTTLAPIQTLGVTRDERTIVGPGEVRPLILPAYCLNRELAPPHASRIRPTPFVYRKAQGSQGDVWQARGPI